MTSKSIKIFNRFSIFLRLNPCKDSSTDEKGAAAALSARLDELLDDIPIQYREVEGNESSRFLSYFPNGLQYLWGGVASGMFL